MVKADDQAKDGKEAGPGCSGCVAICIDWTSRHACRKSVVASQRRQNAEGLCSIREDLSFCRGPRISQTSARRCGAKGGIPQRLKLPGSLGIKFGQ